MEEIWRTFHESDSGRLYQVSNQGRIRSNKELDHFKILSSRVGSDGYLQTALYINKLTIVLNHRLVAEHFLPNPNRYKFVSFRDGDRTNVTVQNLYWTPKKSQQREDSGRCKKTKYAVLQRSDGAVFKSAPQAAACGCVSASCIYKSIQSNKPDSQGFYWRYTEVG